MKYAPEKSCPFCGRKEVRVAEEVIGPGKMEKDAPCSILKRVWLECQYCGACGPKTTIDAVYKDEAEAASVEKWDRRTEAFSAEKVEALERMQILGLAPQVIKEFEETNRLNYSENGILYWVDNNEEWLPLIKEVENEYDILVYHAILTHMVFGRCLSLLYVSKTDKEEWGMDREDIKEDVLMTYTINLDDETSSEFGSIGFARYFGGLKRTA